MNKQIDFKKLIKGAGVTDKVIDKVIKNYESFIKGEPSTILSYSDLEAIDLERPGGAGAIELRSETDGVLFSYLHYLAHKKAIAKSYQESKSWDKVITTAVYSDVKEAQESFIDYVEETYQTKIKDAKHLQKLTGITEETLEGLEETLINSKYSKYFRALEKALQEGVKYKDLLQIKPQDYGLPKTWSGCLCSDQYSSILWALSFEFLINEPGSLMLLPDLRSIAQEIEAPYSVLMDCYNLTNKGKKYGATGN